MGLPEFEQDPVRPGIRHILARVNHPQTNDKLSRFHGEIQEKQHLFGDLDEFVGWYNNDRPHMSLNYDTGDDPSESKRKMPEKDRVLDVQSGEAYDVNQAN